MYAWNQMQKLDTNENCIYLKLEAIYFNLVGLKKIIQTVQCRC
jgi:hypothetical protein